MYIPKSSERGIAHLLLLLLLVAGLAIVVYLTTQKGSFNIFPKASLSKPTGPETSFTLVGPAGCNAGILCAIYERQTLSQQFEVKLYARSDIEKANLFTAKMTFPKNLVEVTAINKDGSFVQNWVEEFYDNATGELSLVGGVAAPGYQTTVGQESALMATIVFNAKAIGKGAVSFTDESEILSNLNNINILTIKRGYDINVEVKPSPTPVSAPIPGSNLGVCVIRDNYTSLPVYNAPDSGVGYAKKNLGAVQSLADAQAKCVGAIFNGLMTRYCSANSNPVQWQVATYVSENRLIGSSSTCAASGCNLHSCVTGTPTPTGSKGDGNKDGKINLIDMSVIHTDWMKTSNMTNFRAGIDMNDDKLINTFDFGLHRNLLLQLGVIKSTVILR